MYPLLRPLFFALDAERAHAWALSFLHALPSFFFKKPPSKPVSALGLHFPHAVGLAAGLDKNGQHLDALAKLGFSFIEVGTVTPKAQAGNPKPRLFRLPEQQAIINRMGFNNQGVHALVSHVKKANYQGILGINIGKNKATPLEKAVDDYGYCLSHVYAYADYVVVNISSPNTEDLRLLQQKQYFSDLLGSLQVLQKTLADKFQKLVPLLVKVSPDEEPETLKKMTEVMLKYGIAGMIASNTTIKRPLVNHECPPGGLSGKPLRESSTQCLRLLKQYVGDELTLIGVGGIDDVVSAQEKLDAGASLIQIYSGLIYQGPGLVYDLVTGLATQ